MAYQEDAALPGYWLYDGIRIQADVETHQFVIAYARRSVAASARILDVAAGEGALTKQLLDAGFQAVSCTSWNDKLRMAVPSYRVDLDAPFSLNDVGGSPFDLVCAIEIIEHVENPASLLRHCAAVLAPGGRLIVSTPNVESSVARLQWLMRGYPASFGPEEIRENRHISMMWRPGLEFLIERAGLRVVEKHLVGKPRLKASVRSVAKRGIYSLIRRLTAGEPDGSTRLYVLEVAGAPLRHGPQEVY